MDTATSTASRNRNEEPSFASAFALDALQEQFAKILKHRYDVISDSPRIIAGSDRILLTHFKRDQNKHIRALHRKVLQGRYTFSPFLGFDIPKPESQEARPISVSTIRDTIVQRALYSYLYPRIEPQLSNSAHGYRMGFSAHTAIRQIIQNIQQNLLWIVDVDFSKFFDSVDHDILLNKLDMLCIDERAHRLVFRYLRTGRVLPSDVEAQRCCRGKQQKYHANIRPVGLPQGGVLSGLLSNLYLAGFDKTMITKSVGYVRYADDFVVCCPHQTACHEAFRTVEAEARKLRLKVNKEKTRQCVAIRQGIDFLGFRITNNAVRVRGGNIHKFKHRIRRVIETQRAHRTAQGTLQALVRRLNFKIRGPSSEQCLQLQTRAGIAQPHRRSWVGFFRIVTDVAQMRDLDRWIRREISGFL